MTCCTVQVSAPEYILLISDLAGEQRFVFLLSHNLKIFKLILNGIFFFCPPPPPTPRAKIWPDKCLGKKIDWKSMKKGGKMHIFSPIGKKYAYFPKIDLRYLILQKKGWQFFPYIKNIIWAKKISNGGGGIWISNLIHPWLNVKGPELYGHGVCADIVSFVVRIVLSY